MEPEVIDVSKEQEVLQQTDDQVISLALKSPHSTMRKLTKQSLFMFLKYFWSEYSEDKFKPNWHIEYICKELEVVAKRVAANEPKLYDLIFNVPPGSTKTAIVSIFFPLWCWVNWFWMRFITASYTSPLSLESAEYSREIIRSDKFKMLYPEIDVKTDKDTKSNFRVVLNKWQTSGQVPRQRIGGNRFSTSVGGTVTGFHGHINIVDDPIDPQRVLSEAELKKANHWMDNTLPFRKVDKKVTVTILIMQRLHQDDPTGHWMKRKKNKAEIKHVCIPGEIRNYRDKVSPPELVDFYKDDLLDPVRLDWQALAEFEELGQFTYGGQIGQDPVPLGGGMFKTDHFTVIESLPHYLNIKSTIRYWDKAGTEGGDGAYTVGVKMCRTKEGKFIVVDVKRGRWSSETREKIIREIAEADGQACTVWIEQEPGSGGKESAEGTVLNLAGFSVHKDRPTGDKAQRADPYSVQVNNGNVMLLRGMWNEDYVGELKFFPNSTFKDQTDASSGAFNKLAGKKIAKVGRRHGRHQTQEHRSDSEE